MYQEALRSPKIIRARALWKHGILVIPHAYSSIGGEPYREDGEVLCVKHMDDDRLRREFQRWNAKETLCGRGVDETTGSYNQEAKQARLNVIVAFGAAAVSVIGACVANSSNDIKLMQYPLALATVGATIKGLFSLKAQSDIKRSRKEDIVEHELVSGNASTCLDEMIERNIDLYSPTLS